MTKVLLPDTNSVWGVIVNPQSSNTYRHAISFENEQMKRDYISQELFKGTDFTTLYADKPEIDFTVITGSKAEFVITPTTYPNETMFTLLNKDFCILQVGKAGEEKYLYYTLSGVRDGAGVKYTAELDIFFTYNIKDMFNDKETEIKRGMFDRFVKDTNGNTVFRDNYLNTPIVNKESFDSDFKDILYPVGAGEDITPDLENQIKITFNNYSNDEPPQFLKDFIIKYISNYKWQQINITQKAGADFNVINSPKHFSGEGINNNNITKLKSSKNDSQIVNLPFVNIITPACSFEPEIVENPLQPKNPYKIDWQILVNGADKIDTNCESFHQKILEEPTVIKNSLQLLPTSPLPMLENIEIEVIVFYNYTPILGIYQNDINITIKESSSDDNNWEGVLYNSSEHGSTSTPAIGIKTIKNVDFDNTLDTKIHTSHIGLNPSNIKNILYEPKLDFSPYTQYQIGSSTKNKSFIQPEKFTKNEIVLRINNSYLTSYWGYQIDLKNYGNVLATDNDYIKSNRNYIIEDFGNYSVPTDQNQWEEFLVRSKSSQNAEFLTKGIGAGLGVAGALLSPFTAGTSSALSGIALSSIAGKSASDINSQIAKRKDIKNSPNQIENNGSTFGFDFVNKSMTPYFQKLNLEPIVKEQIYDHIYKYGYNFDSTLNNINNFINTRYWFNYLEVSESFENIILQASAEVKQIINDTLANGLTIWHCRDLATFKGIKNYEYENVEMSLITAVKGVNDVDKK